MVGGILLVTPNTIMFDPHVNDPLVVEHGTQKYGLSTPISVIASIAIFDDLASMRLRSEPQ